MTFFSRSSKPVVLSIFLSCLFFKPAISDTLPTKYHTNAEVISELSALESANPAICSFDSVGYSNRDSLIIYAFKISDNVSVEEDEPAVFFDGGGHADEVLSVEVVVNFCHDIIEKYNLGDTAIQRFVNNYEIFCFPMANPEGHIVVEESDQAWRKNKTDNNGNGVFDFPDGVDGNRNFDFGWNIDTGPGATTPESLMYKGPYPFSESECRMFRDIAQKYKPLIAVNYHSPTYGRSEVVYYNWYWYPSDGGNGFAPDEPSMSQIGTGFAGSIVVDSGGATYEPRRALVNKGDYKTYMYGNYGTAAFVCEISDTTIQDTSMVDSICERHLPGMYYLLNRAGYARLTGVVTDSITGLPLEATVEVIEATSPDINPRYTRANTGRYNRLINTGTYTLRFAKSGYTTKTVAGVVVTNSGPTTRNVQLAPTNLPPQTPTLLSPVNNAVFIDSVALNFDWSTSPSATGYVIEIAEDSLFVDYFEIDSTITPSNYRNGTSFLPDIYFWRVTAYNGGVFSGQSSVWSFQIQLGVPPPAPVLILPLNGAELSDATPLFDWNNSTGATGYIFELDTDSLFSPPLDFDSNLTISQYQITDSLPNSVCFWRITALNQHGFSPRSAVWEFTINIIIHPATPQLQSPADGFQADTAFLTFDFTDVLDVVNYNIQIDNDSLFLFPLINDSSLIQSQYQNGDSLVNDAYFWRVRAGNGILWSQFSDTWTFDVQVGGEIIYLVGDVNHNGAVNGLDVVYFVNYLKGGQPPPLNVNGFYPEADANGNCQVNGLDVTYLVNFFKGGAFPIDGHCIR